MLFLVTSSLLYTDTFPLNGALTFSWMFRKKRLWVCEVGLDVIELQQVADSLLPVHSLTGEGVVVDAPSLLCMGIDYCEITFKQRLVKYTSLLNNSSNISKDVWVPVLSHATVVAYAGIFQGQGALPPLSPPPPNLLASLQ